MLVSELAHTHFLPSFPQTYVHKNTLFCLTQAHPLKTLDSLELLRGKSGRVFGQMAGLMYTIKGLPTTYDKDLQESVEPLLDHVRTVGDSLQIATGVLSTLTLLPNNMRKALAPEMLATEIADYLVRKGVPFREGHHVSGRVVALAESKGRLMDELGLRELRGVDERLGEDVLECLDYERAVELKDAVGGTSRSAVMEQIEELKRLLKKGRVEGKIEANR